MADSGSFNADLGINMQFNIDGAGLVEMTKTIKEISKGKDLQRYWKDVESATDSAAKAIERYNKNTQSKGLAENFLKEINALKAITNKENLSDIFPNMDINFDKLIESAKKLAPKINAEFSSSSFSQAFKTFDLLRDKGIELGEVFTQLADYSTQVDENSKLRKENMDLKGLFGDQDIEKVKKNLMEVQRLRNEAEETFSNFLNVNKIERTDWWGDEKFSEYFNSIRDGSLTATEAITRFKTEYAYLLEDSFKSNNNTFGLEQLQLFSEKLNSIFYQVENTSNKINEIISNGVIAKSVQNLSSDTSLSDSQRSIFGNLLKDEESLKSITTLFQKLIEESNKTKNSEVFNSEHFTRVETLFESIESHLSYIKSVLVDVGDGEELSPLLKTIDNINTSIKNLSSSVKNIGLNMNIDVGSNSELETKVQTKMSNALQAYQRLFEHIKMSSVGGSAITDKFFQFDINQFDSMMAKIQAYRKFIENARNEAKTFFNGNDVLYSDTEKGYWTQAASAMGQLTKAQNELNRSGNINPLSDLFGSSANLSGVIEQLSAIVSKLDEISVSANKFANVFKDGLNINASVEEIDKLTNRVKELESELAKIKSPAGVGNESNISSGMKDAFHRDIDTSSSVKSLENLEEEIKKIFTDANELQNILDSLHNGKYFHLSWTTDGIDETGADERVRQLSKLLKEYGYTINNFKSDSDAFDTSGVINAIKEENNVLEQTAQSAEKSANSKKKFANTNKEVKDSANASVSAIKEENNAFDQNKWDKNVEAIQKYMNAVSELNRRKTVDKGTGKDAEYIAAQEKEVERLKVVAEEARATLSSMVNPHNADISTWDKWVSVMEQFSKASQGSTDSVARLKDALRNVNEAQNKYISSALSKHEGYFADYKYLIDNKDYLPTNNFREKVAQYKSELQSLRTTANELKSQEFISKEQLQSFEGMVQRCQNARKALQGMNASDKGAWAVDIQKEIDKINSDLMKNTKYSTEAKQKLREFIDTLKAGNVSDTTLKKIHEEFLKITNAEKLAGRAGQSFFDIFKTKAVYGFIGQMQSYLSMYVGFYGMMRGARNAVSTIIELDDALVDLKKTTAMNSSELDNFYYDANDVAKQMGVTTQEIITQASAWSRLSYSSKEASTEMAKLSSQFASISPGMDTTTAQEDLVSIMRAYNIDPDDVKSQIMDKINVLGNNFAESNSDVAEGLKRSAAAMSAMNQSFEDTAALFTGGMEILQDAESMGTALRTLSMRIRGYDEETEQLSDDLVDVKGKVADLTKTTKNAQGISLFTDATQEHYKSMVQYLGEISDEWDDISEKNQTELLQQLFGKNRANAGSAIIKNFDQVRAALEAMEQSAGSSDREMSIIEDSISYKANKLRETWVGTIQQILDRGDLGTIVDGLTKVSEAIGFVTGNLGILKTAAIGIVGYLSFKNIGKCYVSA